MNQHDPRGFGSSTGSGSALLGRAAAPAPLDSALSEEPDQQPDQQAPSAPFGSPELVQSLSEVKGQAQFLLYLADQIEENLQQLSRESDAGHAAFLCKVLAMYSGQLEAKHQGLGDRIAEACQEVYVTVREYDMELTG